MSMTLDQIVQHLQAIKGSVDTLVEQFTVAPAVAPVAEVEITLTMQQVIDAVQSAAQKIGHAEDIRAIFTEFGVASIDLLPPEQYPIFLSKVDALVAGV